MTNRRPAPPPIGIARLGGARYLVIIVLPKLAGLTQLVLREQGHAFGVSLRCQAAVSSSLVR